MEDSNFYVIRTLFNLPKSYSYDDALKEVGIKGEATSQAAHTAGAYPSFCSIKRLGIFLLPPDRITYASTLFHCQKKSGLFP
ncbi:hypothetical protein ACROYT_G000301 [Oculina patagonica]